MKTVTFVDPRLYACVLRVYGFEGILMVFIDIHTLLGIEHNVNVTFCHCEEEATTLIYTLPFVAYITYTVCYGFRL